MPGDKPDPKTWKANFRCAMNSLPDIEEVKDKSIKKGTNAFRVYKMLSASERHSKRGWSIMRINTNSDYITERSFPFYTCISKHCNTQGRVYVIKDTKGCLVLLAIHDPF